MAKSLNLKIKKAKLITSLEKSLADQTKKFEANDKNEAEFKKAQKVYEASVLKLVKSGKGAVDEINKCHTYGWDKNEKLTTVEFSVTYKIPKSLVPKEPEQKDIYPEYSYTKAKEAIENALRMLNLCDDEFVNASTVASVSQYL